MSKKSHTPHNINERIAAQLKKLAKDKENTEVIELLLDIQKNNFQQNINLDVSYLFDQIQSAVAIYKAVDNGNNFEFVYFNKTAEKIDRIKQKKVIGKKVTDIFPGIIEFGLLDVFKKVWETGVAIDHPISVYEDDRTKGWRDNYVYKLPTGEIVATYQDVTKQKQAEEKVHKFELNLKSLINNRDESIWSIDAEYNFIIFNDFFKAHYYKTYKIKLEVGINALDLLSEELYSFWKEKYDRALSGENFSFEYNIKIKKKTHIYEVSLNPIISNKIVTGVSALSIDITERKRSLETIRISEENYRGIFNTSSDAIYILNKEGKFIDVNLGAEKMYGYPQAYFIGKTPEFVDAPKKNAALNIPKLLMRAYKGEKIKLKFWGKRKNGEVFPKDLTFYPGKYNGEKVVLAVAQDISERRKAEEAIRNSETKFKNLIHFAPDAFFHGDDVGNLIDCNVAASTLTGYSCNELRCMNMRDLFSSDTNNVKPLRFDLLQAGKTVKNERELIRKNGKTIVVEMSSNRVEDGTFQTFMRDVTKRKEATNALKESERSFRLLFENSPLGTFIADCNGNIIDGNKALLKMLGSPSIEATKQINVLTFPPLVKNGYAKLFKECVESNKTLPMDMGYTSYWGVHNIYSSYLIPLSNVMGEVEKVYTILENITKRKEAEERYRLISSLTSDYLFVVDIDENGKSIPIWIAGSFKEITGYNFEEYKSIGGWKGALHPDDSLIDEESFIKLKKNENVTSEVRAFHKSGKIVWVKTVASPIWDSKKNKLIGISGACKDITKEKLASIALKENAEKYRLLSLVTSDYVFETKIMEDGVSELIWVGGSFEKITGYSFAEYKKNGGWRAVMHPNDLKIDDKAFKESLANKITSLEVRTYHKSGRIVWVKAYGYPLWDNDRDKLIGILGSVQDISKEKKAIFAVETSKEKYKLISTITSDYLYESRINEDNGLTTVWVAGSFKKITGYNLEEYQRVGGWAALLHKDDRTIDLTALEKLKQNRKAILEVRTYHKSGKIIWIRNTCSPIWDDENNKFLGIVGSAKDITEEKRNKIVHEIQYNITNATVSVQNISELLEIVKTELSKIIDTTNFYIAFIDDKTGMLTTTIDSDENDDIETWSAEKSISGYVVNKKKTLFFYKEEILALSKSGKIDIVGTVPAVWLGVPLKVRNNVVGIMALQNYNDSDIFDRMSVDFLEAIGNQLSLYLERNKALEDSLKLSRVIIQSPVSVVITNIEGEVEYVNPQFEKISGYTFEEVIGENPRILQSGDMSYESYSKLWDTIRKGKDWYGEFLNKRKNGELYLESAVISPIKNAKGEVTHFVGIKEDITEKKRMLEELIASKEKAEISEKIKTEFLAQMSHEIRSPLNVILSFVGLLKEDLAETATEDMMHSFESIDSASTRITRTIDLILNMTDLQLGSYESSLEVIDITKTLEEIYNEYHQSAVRKKIELKLNIAFNRKKITSDRYAIIQIISNLVDNAIKYSDKGFVEIFADNNEKRDLIIKIKDTGIGISEEFLPNIFNSFSQEEQGYTRSYDGNGLGMALVKKYCDTIKSDISVDSEKGKGTTFTLVIPSLKSN